MDPARRPRTPGKPGARPLPQRRCASGPPPSPGAGERAGDHGSADDAPAGRRRLRARASGLRAARDGPSGQSVRGPRPATPEKEESLGVVPRNPEPKPFDPDRDRRSDEGRRRKTSTLNEKVNRRSMARENTGPEFDT